MERIPIFYFRLGRKSFNVLPGSFHSSHPSPYPRHPHAFHLSNSWSTAYDSLLTSLHITFSLRHPLTVHYAPEEPGYAR